MKRNFWNTKTLALGAMCIALSTVLSLIKLFELPNGGSVTPASMLPMMLFAYVYGTVPGLLLGAVYGLLQFLFGGWFLSLPQMLMDYPIAFAMIGLAGLTNKMQNESLGLALGVIIASVGRFIAAVVAGLIFWSDLTNGLWAAMVYSLGYNGSYMGIECVICVIIALAIGPRLVKEIRKIK